MLTLNPCLELPTDTLPLELLRVLTDTLLARAETVEQCQEQRGSVRLPSNQSRSLSVMHTLRRRIHTHKPSQRCTTCREARLPPTDRALSQETAMVQAMKCNIPSPSSMM